MKNSDACFTLIEAGSGSNNIPAGNAIRLSSRIRMHQHFFPHWLDSALLFPSHYHPEIHPAWPHEKMEFVILSALATTTNYLFYLPAIHDDFPEEDKKCIRHWLDWARKNEKYLQHRKDFPQWPNGNTPDGYSHIVENNGFIFWFNGTDSVQKAEFHLNMEETDFSGSRAEIKQIYPAEDSSHIYNYNDKVVLEIPPESAYVFSLINRI